MDMIERLALFADPATIGQLSFADKMLAGLATTLLGMGVTFLSLIVLHGVIVLLGRISAPSSAPSATVPAEQVAVPASSVIGADTVAAITAALALVLGTSPENLVVREIRRVEDGTPAWGRVGMVEQVRSGD